MLKDQCAPAAAVRRGSQSRRYLLDFRLRSSASSPSKGFLQGRIDLLFGGPKLHRVGLDYGVAGRLQLGEGQRSAHVAARGRARRGIFRPTASAWSSRRALLVQSLRWLPKASCSPSFRRDAGQDIAETSIPPAFSSAPSAPGSPRLSLLRARASPISGAVLVCFAMLLRLAASGRVTILGRSFLASLMLTWTISFDYVVMLGLLW